MITAFLIERLCASVAFYDAFRDAVGRPFTESDRGGIIRDASPGGEVTISFRKYGGPIIMVITFDLAFKKVA